MTNRPRRRPNANGRSASGSPAWTTRLFAIRSSWRRRPGSARSAAACSIFASARSGWVNARAYPLGRALVALLAEDAEDLGRGGRDVGARPIDRRDARLLQEVVILRR